MNNYTTDATDGYIILDGNNTTDIAHTLTTTDIDNITASSSYTWANSTGQSSSIYRELIKDIFPNVDLEEIDNFPNFIGNNQLSFDLIESQFKEVDISFIGLIIDIKEAILKLEL